VYQYSIIGVGHPVKIWQFFSLNKVQAELDFVDVDVYRDKRLFVDPYAIEIRDDELSQLLGHHVTSFFQEVLETLRKQDVFRAQYLTENLHEPQETFLGLSKGRPRGRGMGRSQANQILRAFIGSQAFQSGLLSDLSETELFIEGISSDKISDLTTNVIRKPLIDYTQDQCELHEIPTRKVTVGPTWDADNLTWRQNFHDLPVVRGKPVIFVPKVVLRRRLSLDCQEFYNKHVINYLQAEHLAANSGPSSQKR
jgi:hypothetical protein